MLLLQEDPAINRLDESLNLFSQIVNNRFFREASFVLFLNKFDLFREKILYSGRHLRLYFPDYKGTRVLIQEDVLGLLGPEGHLII
jgi:guanine nucleotide-binding protein subunit alpha